MLVSTLNSRSTVAWKRFQEQVEALGGQVLEEQWLGALQKHRIRCVVRHEVSVRPSDVKTEHVDHVRPLKNGGWEHEDNLVPSCSSCNLSKSGKLLTSWDSAKIDYVIEISDKVYVEWLRLIRIVG